MRVSALSADPRMTINSTPLRVIAISGSIPPASSAEIIDWMPFSCSID